MAKGLRSKSKRRFRTLKRQSVVKAPTLIEEEQKKQEALAAVLAAPPPRAEGGGAAAGPAAMEGLQQGEGGGDAAMAVDGGVATTSTNPSKLLKKLRKQRVAATKGIVKGQQKRARPLAGANQFHKKHKKKK